MVSEETSSNATMLLEKRHDFSQQVTVSSNNKRHRAAAFVWRYLQRIFKNRTFDTLLFFLIGMLDKNKNIQHLKVFKLRLQSFLWII